VRLPEFRRYSVVDLFCGCGGLSRGLERTGRFTSILGADINAMALDTFEANHGAAGQRPRVWRGDIKDLGSNELWELVASRGVAKPGELDLLVGGPPCEGFSRNKVYTDREIGSFARLDPRATRKIDYLEEKYWSSAWQGTSEDSARRMRAYNPFLADPRNYLFREFLRVAAELRPKVMIIENVRQMLEHSEGAVAGEILAWLGTNGYHAEARVLNSAEFGVPQKRFRAFILAVDSSFCGANLPWPSRTHKEAEFVTVREAISDLTQLK
jgi:DNA (cytosine-5)-methyltransferase 1